MYRVDFNNNVRKCFQSLDVKSRLSFDKYIAQLKEDGYLSSEIPLAGDHLFRFQIDDDWVAVAQRQEVRTWWGGRTFKIEVLELLPASEFEQSNSEAMEPLSGKNDWIKKATKVITPFVYRHYLPISVVMALVATTFVVVVYKYQGTVDIKMETDGTKVNGEVTIDGRQSQPETDEVTDKATLNDRQFQ